MDNQKLQPPPARAAGISEPRHTSLGRRLVPAVVVLALLAAGAFGVTKLAAPDAEISVAGETATVTRGDLVITVTEGGSLRAKQSIEINSRIEGNATVLKLVPEGKYVEKGEVLCELDSADLMDRKIIEEVQLGNQEADYIAAKEDFEIQKNLATSNNNKAKMAMDFAKVDFDKYNEGDWPQQQGKAQADIIIAKEELQRAEDRLTWTEKLEKEGIVTRQELEADKLSVQKARITLDQATEAQLLLQKYEHPKQLAKLKSDMEEAGREYERVQRAGASAVAQKGASLNARKAGFEIQKEKFKKILDQIEGTIIKAPAAGMIVYFTPQNRWSDQKPIEIGATVRHRQTILTLPDTAQMEIDLKIHESQIDRVQEGQPANVIIDAFADRKYSGTVKKIAVMADSARFFNPDVKVYTTVISIEQTTEGLKPGMSAKVEILADTVKDQLLVPVTAVHILNGRTAAIVRSVGGLEVRQVEIGQTNDNFVVIKSGLKEGEKVMLFEPKAMPTIPWKEEKKETPAETAAALPPGVVPPGLGGNGNGDGNGGAAAVDRPERPAGERPAGGEGRPRGGRSGGQGRSGGAGGGAGGAGRPAGGGQ